MPAETIIKHLNAAKLWIDGALNKYGQGNNHAAYWDLTCAENELKLAKRIELAENSQKDDEEKPNNVIPLPTAWRTTMKVAGGAAACLALSFGLLYNSDYSLRLLSPEEVVIPEDEKWVTSIPPQKNITRVFIAQPAENATPGTSRGVVKPPAREPGAESENQQVAPPRAVEPAPQPRQREIRDVGPKKRSNPSPQKSRAGKPKAVPVVKPEAPSVKTRTENPAPLAVPPEVEVEPVVVPPAVRETPAANSVKPANSKPKPKPKPRVDVLELLSEAEKSLN